MDQSIETLPDQTIDQRIRVLSGLLNKKLQCSRDGTKFTYSVERHEHQALQDFDKFIQCYTCKRKFDPLEDVFSSKNSVPDNRSDDYMVVVDEVLSRDYLLRCIIEKIKLFQTDESLVYRNGALDALRSLAHEFILDDDFDLMEKGELKLE